MELDPSLQVGEGLPFIRLILQFDILREFLEPDAAHLRAHRLPVGVVAFASPGQIDGDTLFAAL